MSAAEEATRWRDHAGAVLARAEAALARGDAELGLVLTALADSCHRIAVEHERQAAA